MLYVVMALPVLVLFGAFFAKTVDRKHTCYVVT